ncbi:MAG: hypothetical protein QM756_25055 [Polyangiaceae bacterium]
MWCTWRLGASFAIAVSSACTPSPVNAPTPPPAVLSGTAHLDCSISSKENGRQRLTLSAGQGIEFDVAVSPIVDGVFQTKTRTEPAMYQFTSHLVTPSRARLAGVGPVWLEKLDARVRVEMDHYEQPGGAGTELTFRSENMRQTGTYVEFVGQARSDTGDVYAFRATLGAAGPGSGGRVTPSSDANRSEIYAKVVMIDPAPITTVVSDPVRVSIAEPSSPVRTDLKRTKKKRP